MTAIALMVTTCRWRYAFAPSCTAAEISCIFSLPGERRMTVMIRKNANTRPMTAHNIDNGTPEFRMVRARKIIRSGSAEGRGL